MDLQQPMTLNSAFFEEVKKVLTVKQWEEEFPSLIYNGRSGPAGGRFKNLIGDKNRTTVLDLTLGEIVRVKNYLGWEYRKLLEEYKLGYNKLTRAQIDNLLHSETPSSSVPCHSSKSISV